MTTVNVRGVDLFVDVVGHGPPLVLMHGGPGLDHTTLASLRPLADEHTLVFYDHRCNGRSIGPPVESMTFSNLTADADALRDRLGFDRWSVLGHSFGGHVALEYVLAFPERVSRLVLLDTAADARWSQEHAASVLRGRGASAATAALARRFYSGRISADRFTRTALRLLPAYDHHFSLVRLARGFLAGGRHLRMNPDALIFGGRHTAAGWSVIDRLVEIHAPTLVLAGRDDFLFPPESQAVLAAGIPDARLRIIERAGHNPQIERPVETLAAIRAFLATDAPEATEFRSGSLRVLAASAT